MGFRGLVAALAVFSGLACSSPSVRQADEDAARCLGAATQPLAGQPTSRHWIPDRPFTFDHVTVRIDLPDLGAAHLNCSAEYELTTLAGSAFNIPLDARNATVHVASVRVDQVMVNFEHLGDRLTIVLPRPAVQGEKHLLAIDYALDGPFPKEGGLIFNHGKKRQGAYMFSQGETDFTSCWLPCRDEPDTKFGATDLWITPPRGAEALGNGELVSREPAGERRETWHYALRKPNAAYLTCFAIGKFEKLALTDPASKMEMTVYRPAGMKTQFSPLFQKTPEMVAFYRKTFGVDYPWPNYRQLQVAGFGFDGMENTTLTTLDLGIGSENELELTIAHELAHQWFGDLITCRRWDDLWIQEGFATFAEGLWQAHEDPEKGYRARVTYWATRVRLAAQTEGADAKPMVNNRWSSPEEMFRLDEDPYTRGAFVYHMLRCELGNEPFFRGVKTLLERFAYSNVETEDVRRVFEDVSGKSLECFFQQWVYRAGMPRLEAVARWDDTKQTVHLHLRQEQRVDESHPPYRFDLPVEIDGKLFTAVVDRAEEDVEFRVNAKPQGVGLDPDFHILFAADAGKGGDLEVTRPQRVRAPGADAGVTNAGAKDARVTAARR